MTTIKFEMPTVEQQAKDMLERLGYPNAQNLTSGDVVELSNLINLVINPSQVLFLEEVRRMGEQILGLVEERDFEAAHVVEDELHILFIGQVAERKEHYKDIKIAADKILEIRDLNFPRHC